MAPNARPRQVASLLIAVGVTLLAGTIAFRETLHEAWFQSFYRSVVTVTLTGLPTRRSPSIAENIRKAAAGQPADAGIWERFAHIVHAMETHCPTTAPP